MGRVVDGERDTAAAESVRAWLSEQTFGDLHPRAVELVRQEDASGEDAWIFVVRLPDPDPAVGTWPVETVNELTRATRDKAITTGVSWPWYIVFSPESDEDQEDEDDQLTLPES